MNPIIAMLWAAVTLITPQSTPNFSGVWELNKTAGSPTKNMPDQMRAKITHQGSSVAVIFRTTARGQTEQNSHTLLIGGESKGEMHGAPMISHAAWEGDALVVRSVATFGAKELKMVDYYTISEDGKTLTFREKHQFATEPEGEDTHVFDRKPDNTWVQDEPPKPAEQVYKNIQIFKGVPSPRVVPVMNMISGWLGVSCDHCHVTNAAKEFEYEKDDKPAKQTARKMFGMVRRIGNEDFSGGSNPVTCWMCHRAQAKPPSMPPANQKP